VGTQRIGPWDLVDGTERDETLLKRARARSTAEWQELLPYRLTVHFRPRSSMPKIPTSEVPAKGYAYGKTILVARGVADAESIYIVLHETAHHLRLTAKQKLGIMELFRPRLHGLPADASSKENRAKIHARFAGKEYWWRPHECHCDQHVVWYTKPKLASPYGYQRRIDDGQAYRAILEQEPTVTLPDEADELDVPAEPDTEPEPPAEPDESDQPSADELQSRIDSAVDVLTGAESEASSAAIDPGSVVEEAQTPDPS
jgi:hypothetical protein